LDEISDACISEETITDSLLVFLDRKLLEVFVTCTEAEVGDGVLAEATLTMFLGLELLDAIV